MYSVLVERAPREDPPGMRKRFADIIRSIRPGSCVVVFLVSASVLFAGSGIALAQTKSASGKPKTGITLPGEPCRVEPRDEWTDIEKWTWIEICEGYDANLDKRSGNTRFAPKNPNRGNELLAKGDKLLAKRKLSPRFLKTILLNEPFRSAIPHRGVWIAGAYFKDKIDLRDAFIERPLVLNRSLFKSPVDMSRFTTSKFVSFNDSTFDSWLDMDSASIGGHLFMWRAKFESVDLREAQIGGRLDMRRSLFRKTLNMNSASIGSGLYMWGVRFRGVVLNEAKIAENLNMNYSRFKGWLNMNSASIGGHLFMRRAILKEVDSRELKVDGKFDMSDSTLSYTQILCMG